jgi:lysine N6-hydroxylase
MSEASPSDSEYDLLGIGLGPFNLGLAALLEDAPVDLDVRFLEMESEFNWHEGMLIEDATLEVPFLADLVTMVDPSNPYSYLNYLRAENRLYEFYFYEEFFIPRREYNAYCRWVVEQLSTIQFDRRVTAVDTDTQGNFRVDAMDPETGERERYRGADLVMGIGSRPCVPDQFEAALGEDVFHSTAYLHRRERCTDAESVTIVGSGQSAAEIFRDLLERQPDHGYSLDWITRSRGFFQMVDGKLGHMVYTPDYTEYFYDLDQQTKDELLREQEDLYKGIDETTSARIYDALYEQSIGEADPDVGLLAATEVSAIGPAGSVPETNAAGTSEPEGTESENGYELICTQWQEGTRFVHDSEVVVLATGYTRSDPPFLAPLGDRVGRDEQGRLAVTEDFRLETEGTDGEIYVQNAELHTHGINAPDLGVGPFRNATIIEGLLGRELYPTEPANTFQSFGAEAFIENRGARPLPESKRVGTIRND